MVSILYTLKKSAVNHLKNNSQNWEKISVAARNKIDSFYSNKSCAAAWSSLFLELKKSYQVQKAIFQPLYFKLPPVDVALARDDKRQLSKIINILRFKGGAVKNKIMNIFK